MLTSTTPAAPSPEAEAFYADAMAILARSGIPFLLGGTFAICIYTGLCRAAKDLDIFCKPGDYPRILSHFRELGYDVAVEDERWIAKIVKDANFIDVIFNSTIAVVPVIDQWFEHATRTIVYGQEVSVMAPTELMWSKVFVQDHYRYDGADVAHLILKQCKAIDWQRLLAHMDQFWEVLLVHLLNFRFIYPTERQRLPSWLLNELMSRFERTTALPLPQTKICRGHLFSRDDYLVDITDWGFADVVGPGERTDG